MRSVKEQKQKIWEGDRLRRLPEGGFLVLLALFVLRQFLDRSSLSVSWPKGFSYNAYVLFGTAIILQRLALTQWSDETEDEKIVEAERTIDQTQTARERCDEGMAAGADRRKVLAVILLAGGWCLAYFQKTDSLFPCLAVSVAGAFLIPAWKVLLAYCIGTGAARLILLAVMLRTVMSGEAAMPALTSWEALSRIGLYLTALVLLVRMWPRRGAAHADGGQPPASASDAKTGQPSAGVSDAKMKQPAVSAEGMKAGRFVVVADFIGLWLMPALAVLAVGTRAWVRGYLDESGTFTGPGGPAATVLRRLGVAAASGSYTQTLTNFGSVALIVLIVLHMVVYVRARRSGSRGSVLLRAAIVLTAVCCYGGMGCIMPCYNALPLIAGAVLPEPGDSDERCGCSCGSSEDETGLSG